MATFSIFRFQYIMYVVEIFAVISEVSGTVRVYLGSSNKIWNINPFRLRFGLKLKIFGWHRFQFSDFKILCTLWRYSRFYLKASRVRVYLGSSNNIWNITPFRLKLGAQLEAFR